MTNGNTWTCDYLQETVQDVDANAEFESERLMCVQAQLQGEDGGCECGGGGSQNCQGLYDSLQEGIIDSELCAQVQQAAGAT
eukprot:CAMPEP_0170922066 /NCGR_PEP_ID=MMETSP0735-20130129/10205_1 /TAXON_ID=186038 /ORGANISM="Fragilariopsis kerguelensis, Strain L26-C5" /LENGTH=81 /DNA_ID=CAMNT_0011321361 /DNA_START=269 /DNA_END=510 /DNA_ORIENTATION=-